MVMNKSAHKRIFFSIFMLCAIGIVVDLQMFFTQNAHDDVNGIMICIFYCMAICIALLVRKRDD
jgi:heme/copper-type cytochrome/quinol oxidase subunit 4